ncbi:MAG: 16S rRNA (cytosine(1402)-N(4))-methyltransferase RsmH [Deltaproteobacteria bacterium]
MNNEQKNFKSEIEAASGAPAAGAGGTHRPVLVVESLDFLHIRADGNYIDATLGGGGHAAQILERLEDGRLLGIDRDPEACARTRERFRDYEGQLTVMEGNYSQIERHCAASGFPPADGLLADLGMSSIQLEDASRGFSFNLQGPLDMRLGPDAGTTAEEIVNRTREDELADLIYKFSEERHSRRIARAIVKARPIRTTTELAQVVTRAIPSRAGLHQIHPATRTFMALRMAVNQELQHLESFLEQALNVLKPGGRAVFITFHSGEDRIVKRALQAWKQQGRAITLTKHVVRAGEEEIQSNPRARSAKLRATEKAGAMGSGSEHRG